MFYTKISLSFTIFYHSDSRNLKDLYNALPLEIFENYHEFEETYIRLIEELTDYVGGYTNAERWSISSTQWKSTI